jgi:hypothetical protein
MINTISVEVGEKIQVAAEAKLHNVQVFPPHKNGNYDNFKLLRL